MSHPAGRVLAMLELLQSHHRLTGAELADRLRVDERTVRRYAATLLDLGIPVTADPIVETAVSSGKAHASAPTPPTTAE